MGHSGLVAIAVGGVRWLRVRWCRRCDAGWVAPLVRSLAVSIVVAGAFAVSALAALPEGRAYEQVSPEFKAGYPVFPVAKYGLAPDGEAASFASYGSFSGSGQAVNFTPYVARRTMNGWVTSGLYPSVAGGECTSGPEVMSADLSAVELSISSGSTARACELSPTQTFRVRRQDGSFAQASPAISTSGGTQTTTAEGSSGDLTRLVLRHQDPPSAYIVPGDEALSGNQLFEAGGSSLRLLAVDNQGKQLTLHCNVHLGSNQSGAFGAVSQPDASEVFFSVAVDTRTSEVCGDEAPHPEQLYVRLSGRRTVEVSRPLTEGKCIEVPCLGATSREPAVFQGASEDGSKVFFTTTTPLVAEDKDSSNDLYMARIGCPGGPGEACEPVQREVLSLTLVSHDPRASQPAEVESHVLAISPDGSHVYFVARGVLSEGANGEGETAVHGAENLYVYDGVGTGSVSFIADLCSGPAISGNLGDGGCPPSLDEKNENPHNDHQLWSEGTEHREAQTTGDGRFIVFSTYAQLIRNGPETDSDDARDVYRYDAQTARMERVSLGEKGFDGNGNRSGFDASITETQSLGALQEQYELGSRAISEDGSTIVFTTSEPLSADATNGKPDVYAWHEGRVGMISSGASREPDERPIISASGRDIVFMTSANLLPSDTDGLRDVYDARIGGGFSLAPAASEPCSGDACQGPLSVPAPLPVPGSVSQPTGGNLPVSALTVTAKKKVKHKARKKRRARRRRSVRARRSARQRGEGRGGR